MAGSAKRSRIIGIIVSVAAPFQLPTSRQLLVFAIGTGLSAPLGYALSGMMAGLPHDDNTLLHPQGSGQQKTPHNGGVFLDLAVNSGAMANKQILMIRYPAGGGGAMVLGRIL